MCALFGFLDYGKRVPWKIMQNLVQALANASEVRGHHASGINSFNKDGLPPVALRSSTGLAHHAA